MNNVLKILSKFKTIFIVIVFLMVCVGGLLLLGAVLITAAENNYVTINVFLVLGIFLNLWLYRKFRKPLLQAESWKRESRVVGFLGLMFSVLASINYWQGIITAPVVFFVIGAYALYVNYSISEDGKKNLEKYASDPKFKYEPLLKRTPQWVVGSLVALLLTSGYWYVEIQKNEQIRKDEATEESLLLTDYAYYREYPSNANIKINSVVDIKFSKIKAQEKPGKVLNVCLDTRLSFSRDGRYYQEIYVPTEICFTEENVSGWWADSVRDVVKDSLKAQLDNNLR
jgi:hypothetical protein